MKKFLIPVAAALLVSGVASAQTSDKSKKMPTPAQKATTTVAAKPAPATRATTTSVAPSTAAAAKPATDAAAADKAKHHHQKTKPATKTSSK